MNDSPINAQLDVVSIERWAEIVLYLLSFSQTLKRPFKGPY